MAVYIHLHYILWDIMYAVLVLGNNFDKCQTRIQIFYLFVESIIFGNPCKLNLANVRCRQLFDKPIIWFIWMFKPKFIYGRDTWLNYLNIFDMFCIRI